MVQYPRPYFSLTRCIVKRLLKACRLALVFGFAALVCACGVSVEQPPGNKVHAAVLTGNWDTSIHVKGVERGVLSIQATGDDLLLQWRGSGNEGASAHSAVFAYGGRQYLAINNSPGPAGYGLMRLDDVSSERIQAHMLDGERAAQLLAQINRPVVYRDRWLHKELFLDKAAFAALMESHADALFDKGIAVTLDKVR